jgi:hypothetical protein
VAQHPSLDPAIMMRRQAEFDGAKTAVDVARLEQKWQQEDRRLEAAETAQAQELIQLRQRVAKLEHLVSRKGPLVQAVGDLAEHLGTRIHALEQRPVVKYCGVYDEAKAYVPGNMVTYNGSVWHCASACEGQKPPGPAWTLAVKHGRDGKDAPQPREPVVR